jgi:hypothetical protein
MMFGHFQVGGFTSLGYFRVDDSQINLIFALDTCLDGHAIVVDVIAMGCRQVVRHLVLVQTFRGSNPCTPVKSTAK